MTQSCGAMETASFQKSRYLASIREPFWKRVCVKLKSLIDANSIKNRWVQTFKFMPVFARKSLHRLWSIFFMSKSFCFESTVIIYWNIKIFHSKRNLSLYGKLYLCTAYKHSILGIFYYCFHFLTPNLIANDSNNHIYWINFAISWSFSSAMNTILNRLSLMKITYQI